MNGLARLWRLLTEAPAAVLEPGRRRQVQLLSGLLVVLIPLGLLSIGVQLLFVPGFWLTFVAVAGALVVLLLAYGLARAGKFAVGAVIAISAAALASFAVVTLNLHDSSVYAYLLFPILLAALLFSEIGTWVTAAGVLLGVSVLLPAWGVPPPDNDPLVVPIFIVIATALLLLGIRHRNTLERDRQVELAASEARFRSFADATLEGVVFTENGRIIDISERGAALVGATGSAALIGRNIMDFCAPADRERVAMQMRNNVTTPYEFTIRRVDGSEFPGEVRGRTSLYHNRPVRVTVFRDLTERKRAEEELRHEREFTSTVFDTAGSLIVVLDRAGRIVRFNRSAEELTGYRFDELRGQMLWDYFLSPEESAAVKTVFKRLTANDIVARYENHWRMRDGSYRLFDWSNRVITDGTGNVEYIVSVGIDITERKRIEQVTQRLNRLLNTLGAVNPVLVRADSEAQLFAGVCRTLVEQGEFSMSWVGLADAATQRVQVACQSGFQHGYLDKLDIRYDDSPQGRGPTGMAIRSGRTVINEDTETSVTFAPWRERARQHGYRSTVAIPLRVHGQVVGSLNVYAALPHAFGLEDVVLLEKLAGDIGMAVERLRAIDRIATSERELATILQNMQDTYYRTDQDGRIVRASESATKLLGYVPDEMLGMRLADFYVDAHGRERFLAALKAASGMLQNYEAALRHRNGSVRWVSTNAQYVRAADGRVIGIEGTTRDITERKRAENNLLEIARGVSATTGESFFHSLVAHLSRVLEADFTFVGELVPGRTDCVRSIAMQALGAPADNFEFDLAGTPCENMFGQQTCIYPSGVQQLLAPDHLLAKMGVEACVGTPLFDTTGLSLGLMVVMFRRPIALTEPVSSTLQIFAARAGAELERVRTEQALRDSEARYRNIVETAQEGIWQIDADNRTTFVNQKMADMLGYTVEEMHGRPLFDFMDDDGKAITARNVERRRQGIAEEHEFKFRRRDGGGIWTLLNTTPLTDDAGQYAGAFAMITDITERKRSGDALLESQRRLETLMGNLPGMAYRCRNDHDWTLEFMSVGVRALTGHAPEDFMSGRVTYNALIHPDDRELVWQQVQAALAAKRSYQLVYRVQAADGTLKWVWEQGLGIYAPDGELQYLEGFVTDITERRHAEQALIQSESNFRALTENANVGILVNHRGRHVFANNRLLTMLGYSAEEFRQTGVKELVHPLEYDKVMERFRERMAGESAPNVYETVFMTRDGQAVPVELTAAKTTWQGEPAGLVFLHDIRERLRTEEQMRKLSSALEQIADSVVITDRQGIIEYVNPGFEKTTGYSRDEALGQTPRLVKSGKQGAGFYKKLWDTILAGEVFSEVFVNRRKDGSLYYEEKTISPLKDPAGQVTHFVATGKDVTDRMQAQERLQHMAQHDALTELPNRVLFLDRLKQAVARARWHERLVAVLFVDMDRFKTINDTLGHEVGDKLLQALAERFTASVREGDTVARFGGDEFVVLLDDVASEKDISAVAQKVLETLAPPFAIDGQSLYITASIGVSLYPNDGEDSTTLLKNADIAMYRAKDLGKNTYQFYSADMSARAFERLTLESSLRHAIERNEFRLYYQPQIDTASGAILGVEALLRWQHPDFGLVAPAEFIPLLEETGLIVPAGNWVLHTACEQLHAWHAAGWPQLRMAVNLSPRQFQTAGLAETVRRALSALGCDPGMLELEITESVLLRHTAATLETLEALHALGVRMAIDDFGTGYSSLSYLRRYSIDTLKIDRSFVHDVPGDADDSALASAIIVLAQSLKLDVIAEGVETEAQRDFLRERGCHQMQGYLFSRPLPAEDITRLLEKAGPQMYTAGHGRKT